MYSTKPQYSRSDAPQSSQFRQEHNQKNYKKSHSSQRHQYHSKSQQSQQSQYHSSQRHHPKSQPQPSIPTVDQISKLVQQVFEPAYDPENWSILDERSQHTIRKIIYHTPVMDLSIRRVLEISRLGDTPSTIAFIKDCIRRKFNSLE